MNRCSSRSLFKRWLLVAACSLCITAQTRGAELSFLLEHSGRQSVAGEEATVWLNVLNVSEQEQRWTFPSNIVCHFVAAAQTNSVSLELSSSTSSQEALIAPRNFDRRSYRFRVPLVAPGLALLEPVGLNVPRLALEVTRSTNALADSQPVPKTMLQKFLQEAEPVPPGETFDGARFFREHVSAYEPLYFIAGTDSPNTKFQVSFKYRLLNKDGPLARSVPPLTGFHVAYSQTSLWDWDSDSAPFFDSSYRPEILYVVENLTGGESNAWFRLDVQTGFQHESNGRDGAESRSFNIAYLRPRLIFGRPEGFQFILQPRAWTYVGDLSDNPDIDEYRGYADLRAIVGWQRGPQLSATGWLGKDGNHESLQLDFTYPLMGFFPRSFSLYLHVQYFTGYGESLVRYNQQDSSLRAGFALTR